MLEAAGQLLHALFHIEVQFVDGHYSGRVVIALPGQAFEESLGERALFPLVALWLTSVPFELASTMAFAEPAISLMNLLWSCSPLNRMPAACPNGRYRGRTAHCRRAA